MKKIYILFILISSISYSQCSINHVPSSPLIFTIEFGNVFLWGQGFTAECDGYLEYVELFSAEAGVVSAGTLNIYSGNGVSGTPIHTQQYEEITISQIGDPIRITLTGNLALSKNSQYTFEFPVDNVSVYGGINDEYSGGSIWQNTNTEYPDHDFSFTVAISETSLSINEYNEDATTFIFPNPAESFIKIYNLIKPQYYKIYNMLGKEVSSGIITDNENINIENLTSGVYFLKLENANALKFIKS
ncbi:hypothetical protein BTO04_04430 [Polaribacter sp. SA4-10]|uniref:T9SS type A sorting domain-containing protein n=1 Tax=Polaribacter sp. SA4-10 TaxID=754397 RepID=UPI000B3D3A44|nr:T9SS type A sorting domain-containing protein [Polaribacter sp. SA4-10]ARV05993.1 hypothetical protein BTO04_04430 [Polaribacter sp. SA4-10]